MTTLTETGHPGGFIISKANGNLSFDNIELDTGVALVAGEVFALSAGKAVKLNPADSTGGTDEPGGIAFSDGAAGQVIAAVTRSAEVNGHELIWPTGISDQAKADAIDGLAAAGVIVR